MSNSLNTGRGRQCILVALGFLCSGYFCFCPRGQSRLWVCTAPACCPSPAPRGSSVRCAAWPPRLLFPARLPERLPVHLRSGGRQRWDFPLGLRVLGVCLSVAFSLGSSCFPIRPLESCRPSAAGAGGSPAGSGSVLHFPPPGFSSSLPALCLAPCARLWYFEPVGRGSSPALPRASSGGEQVCVWTKSTCPGLLPRQADPPELRLLRVLPSVPCAHDWGA